MIALDAAAKKGLEPALVELVKIRASQLNHCAFCIDMHIKDARQAGETEQRIYLLNAWEEATAFYSPRSRRPSPSPRRSPSSPRASFPTPPTTVPPPTSARPSSPS